MVIGSVVVSPIVSIPVPVSVPITVSLVVAVEVIRPVIVIIAVLTLSVLGLAGLMTVVFISLLGSSLAGEGVKTVASGTLLFDGNLVRVQTTSVRPVASLGTQTT